jgi:hypothetical protein
MFAESNTRVRQVLLDWLERFFPASRSRSTTEANLRSA